jgi:beta-aspartyl-peptidase (threonine type)
MSKVPGIIVHGGAGLIGPDRIPAARAGCAEATAAGLAVLRRGGSALDAVQAAVRVLEEEPGFNAGVGSALTRDGTVEVDASIMDGATLAAGAIGAVPFLRRPVDLARQVLDDGEHVFLVGEGAWRFARERGHAPARPEEMITERARQKLEKELRDRSLGPRQGRGGERSDHSNGTVGACAIDARGHVAAATSTGGMTGKRPGRVGDSPLIGCGTYADDRGGAASATGTGEIIIRLTTSRVIVDAMRRGLSAEEAARLAVADVDERIPSDVGVICVDREGRLASAKNTETMPTGRATLERPEPATDV